MKKHSLNLYPEIIGDEYERLKQKIIAGYDKTFPIIVYQDAILDGWNRYRACKEVKVEPVIKQFIGNDADAIEFVLLSNERRDLTKSQRAVMAVEYEPLIAKESEKRMKAGKKINPSQKIEQGKSSEIAGLKFAVNRQYVSEVKKIRTENPEYFEKLKSGEMSIQDVKQDMKRGEVEKRNNEIRNREIGEPDGKYDVIVIDPPWEMEKIERDVSPEQVGFDYPMMTINEIKEINLPCNDDCHLFLWTTQKYLPYSFDILLSWGMKYIFTMVWHKNGGFQPFNLPQYNCEFILYARKGIPKFVDTKAFNTCFLGDRTRHSEKPEQFYELIRRVTVGRRIDMFNRREIKGFDVWGKES